MGCSLLITPTREWMKGNPFPLSVGLNLKQIPLYIIIVPWSLAEISGGSKNSQSCGADFGSIVFTRIFILHEKHPRNARES